MRKLHVNEPVLPCNAAEIQACLLHPTSQPALAVQHVLGWGGWCQSEQGILSATWKAASCCLLPTSGGGYHSWDGIADNSGSQQMAFDKSFAGRDVITCCCPAASPGRHPSGSSSLCREGPWRSCGRRCQLSAAPCGLSTAYCSLQNIQRLCAKSLHAPLHPPSSTQVAPRESKWEIISR